MNELGEKYRKLLQAAGIHEHNKDPQEGYCQGKRIINNVLNIDTPREYDFLNDINSKLLQAALDNQERRELQAARENDWDGYFNELHWRQWCQVWIDWEGVSP